MPDMKTVTFNARCRYRTLHIEAPGCIINVRIGLTNQDGQQVTSVSINADGHREAGADPWYVATDDFKDVDPERLREGFNVRVVRHTRDTSAPFPRATAGA